MPTLEELRKFFQTDDNDEPENGDEPKTKKAYKISTQGSDALVLFGNRHRGKTLSQIKEKDPGYLDFILKGDFPEELKDVVRYQKSIK